MGKKSLRRSLALVSTFHDREGANALLFLKKHLETIKNSFDNISLVLTESTSLKISSFLSKNGIKITTNPAGAGSQARKKALRKALKTSCDYFLYLDFDHLLFWLEKYPEEFFKTIKQIKSLEENHYLVIGRTNKAWDSYPENQKIPEKITNQAISEELKKTIDVTPGCRAFRREIALSIVKNAQGRRSGVSDVEWVMIASLYCGAKIKTILVDGLGYETKLIFGQERAKKSEGEYEFSRVEMQKASIGIINETRKTFLKI